MTAATRSVLRAKGTAAVGLACGALALVSPPLAVVVSTVALSSAARRNRRRRAAANNRLHASLVETVDLYAVALASGHNVATATSEVCRWTSDPLRTALSRCVGQVRRGRVLSDALEAVAHELGDDVRPLISALVSHERHGAPIAVALRQVAFEMRQDRRRRAEAAARRLPVVLLFPLVLCVLPAFLLLTVVPVVAEAIASALQ